ncbi:MAG: hypothetical protein ACW98F_12030 [Candidatus Hodarchaeales archaeon]
MENKVIIRIDSSATVMAGTIAWTRLTIYLGSSILLLTEIYRLSLIMLTLIVIAPPLMAFLQNIVQWGLLLGFTFFTMGIYRVLRTHPPILNFEVFSFADLNTWAKINAAICALLVILTLLPPTTLVTSNVAVLFSIIVSLVWLLFYSLLVFWIIIYWKVILQKTRYNILRWNQRITTHLVLGILIASYWGLEVVSLLLFQEAISTIDPVNLSYIIVLNLFLFNQVLLFFQVRKFSYVIYG